MNIFCKYREDIQNFLEIDNLTVNILEDEFSRKHTGGIRQNHPLPFYILLSSVTTILFTIFRLPKKYVLSQEDFVFISCPDPVFRTKNINLIAEGLNYGIVFLPNFHIKESLYYSAYFDRKGIKAFFPTFSLSDVCNAYFSVKHFVQGKCGCDKKNEKKVLISHLFMYKVYDNLIQRQFANNTKFEGKWLFEHQKFYFMPAIEWARKHGKESILLQHGCFFAPSFNYFPVFCDKVLCCSQREKEIYIDNGIEKERVVVFGAPLQTIGNSKNYLITQPKYDAVVLMPAITSENIVLVKNTIDYLSHKGAEVLIRMRPRSYNADLSQIKSFVREFHVSECGVTLADDLALSNRVISFSEDTSFELVSAGKSFILISPSIVNGNSVSMKCADENTFKMEIDNLFNEQNYCPYSLNEIEYMIGETDVDALKKRFTLIIKTR